MLPIFQTKFGTGNSNNPGNCLQAVIASLLELNLNDVPHFMEYGNLWAKTHDDFLVSKGYKYTTSLNNPYRLGYSGDLNIFKKSITKLLGVNGFFSAKVYSPKYFNITTLLDPVQPIHAVIIDKDFNIIHDPVQANKDIEKYPLANLLDCNGIISYDVITKI